MAPSVPPDYLQLLIAGYVLGDLDPSEAADFEQLLKSDPAIVQEVNRVQQALEASYAPAEVAPPSHLRSKILSASAQKQRSEIVVAPVSDRKGIFSWSRAVGVAAAALIVALGVNNYRLWRDLEAVRTSPVESSNAITYSLEGTEQTDASATVIVDAASLEAVITAQNLPPLPNGKVYVLWTVVGREAPFTTDDKGAILTNVFEVNAEGDFSGTIAIPQVYRSDQPIEKVAITVEDAASPQSHTGPIIAVTRS